MIWMPAEHMLVDAQRASVDLPEFMGLAWSSGQDDLGHRTDTHSTTPLQLSDALWNWSGGDVTPWEVIPPGLPNQRRKRSWPDLAAGR